MANQTIVNFVKQHLGQGYTIQQIKEYIIKYGFKEKEIDEAVDFFYQKQSTSSTSGSQINAQLLTYIKQNLARGYTPEQVRNYLLQNGYDAGTIEQALSAAMPHHVRHIIEIHPQTIAHIFMILLLVAGIVGGV